MLRAGFSRLSALSPAYMLGGAGGGEALPAGARSRALSKELSLSHDSASFDDMTRQFDFGRLVAAFEAVTFPPPSASSPSGGGRGRMRPGSSGQLPHTASFLTAMDEVLLLFDHLGSAFAFVRRDIAAKTAILRAYAGDAPPRFVDLATAVRGEIAAGTADSKPPPSAARTLLRLMWALKFIDCLLAYLREATAPRSGIPLPDRTLRAAVSDAYEQALSEHHSWALRKTVRTALSLLPTKEVFMDKVCPDERLRQGYLNRLAGSMTPMRETMYQFYEEHGLLNLA